MFHETGDEGARSISRRIRSDSTADILSADGAARSGRSTLFAQSAEATIASMTGLDYFTFVVLAVLIAAGIALAFVLGSLPGKIAVDRDHPQADAIRVAGWLGLLTLGLLFPVALIWAYTKPSASEETETLRQEIDRLGERVGALEAGDAPMSGEERRS